ncbi:MAG: DUF3604 domain-containing protein, partial [Bacillota bacterium]|nr:DUF3604 domain-containing protein [Bacillota bacterium]
MKQDLRLGTATINPSTPVEVGSHVTITLTYTAAHPIDDSGFLKICFRQQGDFGRPQFADPGATNYCTVRTSGNCRITPRWDPKGHTRPWAKALFLQIGRGYLDEGDTVEVVFGDRAGGSPGWRTQTFVENTFEFKVFVDPIATYEFKELPESPVLEVRAGKPARSLCIAPSEVPAGEPFIYHVKTEDCWGNPVGQPLACQHAGFRAAGVQTVAATDRLTGLEVVSNPVRVVGTPSTLHPYWADFHGQSEETVGSNSIEDYFAFARDRGLLDIAGHQGNDFQVTDDFWDKINHVSHAYNRPSKFITFPGYEWSGNTPLGGDRNVYFASEGGRISHSSTDLLPGKSTAFDISPTAVDLFRDLARSKVRPFVFAHVGGRYADIAMHDPELEVAVEIHSAWGTFEWLLEDALRRGYRIGIVANSDDHKCRPGASYPGSGEFGSLGGLTCVLAERLDREALYAALAARHCYATTGNRPLLDVTVTTPGGRQAMMGDVVAVAVSGTPVPVLNVSIAGTAAIESVDVRNELDLVETLRPKTAGGRSSRIKLVWSGAEVRGRDRLTRWDGGLTVDGNGIAAATPINFWNADWPLERAGHNRLAWRSNTTGGLAGVIIELEDADRGSITVSTLQGQLGASIASIGPEPTVVEYGGLGKRMALYRLPAAGA